MTRYILDEHGQPSAEADVLTWAKWFEEADRCVADAKIGACRVSTVFLGIDHNFGGAESDPMLWETMIFGGPHDGWQDRYTTIEAAKAGHEMAVAIVKGETTPEAVAEMEESLR